MIDQTQLQTIESDLLQGKELMQYQQADSTDRPEIDALMQQIDFNDSHSLLYFGAPAQQQLAKISDDMLDGVRNKDTGAAGESLNSMMATVRGFDISGLDPDKKQGFLARLLGKAKPLAQFMQQYELVRDQIDAIGDDLERHKTQLLTDVTVLDRLYNANLEYFHQLEQYIIAGEEKLRQIDNELIPAQEKRVENSDKLLDAQELRDLRSNRDAFERRIHDLKLTRQVAMQSLPSIRLVQENDKGLINKIISTTANTLPLWRTQLAQAVTIHRSREAAASIRNASDLTNELLKANAENLKIGNAEARQEIERGVFDIEAVKQANEVLIETIQESLQIADEGRQKRNDASIQLQTLEAELRKALKSASASENKTSG